VAVEIRRLEAGDEGAVAAAGALFDDAPRPEATRRFLREPSHHLLLAVDDDGGDAVGFVSGVEITHPDKGTEMLLYELAVEPGSRRRGIGRLLVEALAELAERAGCYDMFVLVDDDNAPALATYASAGGRAASRPVMVEWELRRGC
jgi:ribosomal protein S18 acetylase RimI-like enzyme